MRRRSLIAGAALAASLGLAAWPLPAASRPATPARGLDLAAFRRVVPTAMDQREIIDVGPLDIGARSAGFVDEAGRFIEPGQADVELPAGRPAVAQPAAPAASDWKPPRYTLQGYATFYDHGTTAMRLPRGTIVRICGAGGCIERTIDDYGPVNVQGRIVDLYRPDFFDVCGCAWFAGSAWVTVSVY